MPELAPYSLSTLAFLIFSALVFQLRLKHPGGPPLLSWFAGFLLIMTGVRLFVGALRYPEHVYLGFDKLLLFGVLMLIAFAVGKVLMLAATEDP